MFYDISHRQWVTCTRSYPHDVKKDGYLLLRRPSIKRLVDFDNYLSLALEKPLHFRNNLVHDRTYVKNRLLHKSKNKPTISKHNHYKRAISDIEDDGGVSIIEVSDDEPPSWPSKRTVRDKSIDDRPLKRQRHGSVSSMSSVEDLPSQHQRHGSITSICTSSIDDGPSHHQQHCSIASESMCTSRPFSPSSLPPSPSLRSRIFVPESSKQWPHGMFTVDMKKAFLLVDSVDLKGLKLQERVNQVLGINVPLRTFQEQKMYWKSASEHQRQQFVDAGRCDAGLWSTFRNHLKK